MITVMIVLAVSAFISCLVAIAQKCPIWLPILLLCIIALLKVLPMGGA